jgi:hypothetical protein
MSILSTFVTCILTFVNSGLMFIIKNILTLRPVKFKLITPHIVKNAQLNLDFREEELTDA